MAGSVNERLRTEFNKMLVLDYLLTELKSARMIHANKPDTTLKVNLVGIIIRNCTVRKFKK